MCTPSKAAASPPSIPSPHLRPLRDIEAPPPAPLDLPVRCARPDPQHCAKDPLGRFAPLPLARGTLPAQLYPHQRPETTSLNRIAQEHLETYLALAQEAALTGNGVPEFVEDELRSFLRCSILAHGSARARRACRGYDLLLAFSCKGRDAYPSCNAKRMAQTLAHLVHHVFPHVSVWQWVLSVPKRLRPFLYHRPRATPASPSPYLRFHKAATLSPRLLEDLQHTIRGRALRHFARHGLLEPHEADDILAWDHGGGFSLNARVRIEANDRTQASSASCAAVPGPRSPWNGSSSSPAAPTRSSTSFPNSIPPSSSPFPKTTSIRAGAPDLHPAPDPPKARLVSLCSPPPNPTTGPTCLS